jgi:hypothetical protein
MNQRCFLCLLLAMALTHAFPATAPAAKPWEMLIPFKRVDAAKDKEYRLTENQGPWMILAASFAGPGAEQQAKQLVYELRRDLNVEAYIHEKSYDFTQPVQGLGLNRYGGPKMMRHANASKFEELAVLTGNFSNVNDPAIEKMLDKVKYARPDCLDINKNTSTTQRFIGLRELQKRFSADTDRREQGPMRNAFLTRNPLLPQEYFVPEGLDPLVERMNRDLNYSLLNNKGRYTVRVASFRGSSTMKLDEIDRQGRGLPSKLEEAGIKAHDMTQALRKQGVEAYEFHDRYESIVTIGSFETMGRDLPDGKTELDPRIIDIMKKYGAQQQQLPGQASVGLVPRELKGIPFDVQPLPVEVPQRSVAAAYAPSNRLFQ